MPIATRRQAHTHAQSQDAAETVLELASDEMQSQSLEDDAAPTQMTDSNEQMEAADPEEEEDEDEEEEIEEVELEPFPPPGLKEISSLASWTVSTAKPGNGVAALRSPDTSLFWQSDGPQPHLLSIHFFKLVSIVHMRIFLDFENDESYTPTKIQFLAGMGVHDLQDFAEMSFEQPTGWIDVDFSNVGPIEPDDEVDDADAVKEIDWTKRPVLRAFLVQVKILENHQNGKDTHLRAVQIYARDEAHETRRTRRSPQRVVLKAPMRSMDTRQKEMNNIKMASWMCEPDLR